MNIDFVDFKNITLFLLGILFLFFGVFYFYNTEMKFRDIHNYRKINGIELVTIDGHDYIYRDMKVVCHYASCENPTHK